MYVTLVILKIYFAYISSLRLFEMLPWVLSAVAISR